MRIWPGEAYPLGATYDGIGTNFAVFSEMGTQVELCVFDDDGNEERLTLPERTGAVWHGYSPDVGTGTRYGFRAQGNYDPSQGQRFNPNKLLLDPYAKAIEGEVQWNEAVFNYHFDDPQARNDLDSAPFVPRSVVVNPFFDWSNDQLLRHPFSDTMIYEVHVKGATARHPDIEPELRGTYGGIAHPAFVEHLTKLGITAVELMPVHQFIHDSHLVERKLRNYWGYNSIGFLAPHNDYGERGQRGEQVQDFKQMVKALHSANLEVILDVVYNHTAEGNHMGPVLSMKGLDNQAYYRLTDDPQYYMDYTGTGNTLNMRNPHALQLVMDSLRYWVTEMHVDGFSFDLASTLARGLHEVDRLSAFFDLIQQDPVIGQVKLIAEPWDVGEGGYQVGNFPAQWAEWNGKYRDTVRDHWIGADHRIGEFAYRLTGSSDLYESDGRSPHASINFITAHDGFTLRDLVSYNDKHNEANGEDNNDGEGHNRSWNGGIEGPTDDPDVLANRALRQRSLLATLVLSQGVPMLLGGDEMGRTQQGNNNAYCQDSEISWFDWEGADQELLQFARALIAFRGRHKAFRRRGFFQGRPIHGVGITDLAWFTPAGAAYGDDQWNDVHAKSLAVFLNGTDLEIGPRGESVEDDSFLLLINAHSEPIGFTVPGEVWGKAWTAVVDTATSSVDEAADATVKPGEVVQVQSRSIIVLRRDPVTA
ncbi:MAG: glycogen debranching protein [Acidimicrobiia bacterium]|nr:glycogen debranching protein [Acidimicrobiia bacterium]